MRLVGQLEIKKCEITTKDIIHTVREYECEITLKDGRIKKVKLTKEEISQLITLIGNDKIEGIKELGNTFFRSDFKQQSIDSLNDRMTMIFKNTKVDTKQYKQKIQIRNVPQSDDEKFFLAMNKLQIISDQINQKITDKRIVSFEEQTKLEVAIQDLDEKKEGEFHPLLWKMGCDMLCQARAYSQIHNAYIQDYFSCALQWNSGGHIKSTWPPKFHCNARGKNLNLGN